MLKTPEWLSDKISPVQNIMILSNDFNRMSNAIRTIFLAVARG